MNFKKRALAYLLDAIIVSLILMLLNTFIPPNENIVKLNKEMIELQQSFVDKKISDSNYILQISNIVKDVDRNSVMNNVISVVVLLLYFVIWPFYHKGQTLGKKRMNIRVVKDNLEEASMNDLLLRNIIINNIGYMLIQLLIVFILPGENYYMAIVFMSFIQFILVLASMIMIYKRKDNKGVHDLIAKTKVIEVEK